MAAVKPESFARRSSLLLKALLYVLRPLIAITNYISSKVLKIFNINVKMSKSESSSNVLVWLDQGPYAYINLGIATSLSKLDNFNFYGMKLNIWKIIFYHL